MFKARIYINGTRLILFITISFYAVVVGPAVWVEASELAGEVVDVASVGADVEATSVVSSGAAVDTSEDDCSVVVEVTSVTAGLSVADVVGAGSSAVLEAGAFDSSEPVRDSIFAGSATFAATTAGEDPDSALSRALPDFSDLACNCCMRAGAFGR